MQCMQVFFEDAHILEVGDWSVLGNLLEGKWSLCSLNSRVFKIWTRAWHRIRISGIWTCCNVDDVLVEIQDEKMELGRPCKMHKQRLGCVLVPGWGWISVYPLLITVACCSFQCSDYDEYQNECKGRKMLLIIAKNRLRDGKIGNFHPLVCLIYVRHGWLFWDLRKRPLVHSRLIVIIVVVMLWCGSETVLHPLLSFPQLVIGARPTMPFMSTIFLMCD